MSVFDLALWGIGLVLLPIGIFVFRSVVISRSWRVFTLLLVAPASTSLAIYAVVERGWIAGLPLGILLAAISLFGSTWRYVTANYIERQVRDRFDRMDSATQDRMRQRANHLPLPFWRKWALRLLEQEDEHR